MDGSRDAPMSSSDPAGGAQRSHTDPSARRQSQHHRPSSHRSSTTCFSQNPLAVPEGVAGASGSGAEATGRDRTQTSWGSYKPSPSSAATTGGRVRRRLPRPRGGAARPQPRRPIV